MKSISRIRLIGLIAVLLFGACAAAETPPAARPGEIVVHAIDSAGALQAGAAVSFSTFDNATRLFGEMSPVVAADLAGNARLERLSGDNGYYLVRARTWDGRVGYRTCLLD